MGCVNSHSTVKMNERQEALGAVSPEKHSYFRTFLSPGAKAIRFPPPAATIVPWSPEMKDSADCAFSAGVFLLVPRAFHPIFSSLLDWKRRLLLLLFSCSALSRHSALIEKYIIFRIFLTNWSWLVLMCGSVAVINLPETWRDFLLLLPLKGNAVMYVPIPRGFTHIFWYADLHIEATLHLKGIWMESLNRVSTTSTPLLAYFAMLGYLGWDLKLCHQLFFRHVVL